MLRVFYSNRLESLAERLAVSIATPLDSPFTPETILVESQAMARWLSLQLASRLGVCANFRFPFPDRFLWEVFQAYLPDLRGTTPLAPAALTWRVLAALEKLSNAPAFAPVRDSLRAGDERKAYALAARIAAAFDCYQVYRPDWIRQWEAGEEEHWQAEVWRFIAASLHNRHWAGAQQACLDALQRAASYPETLPKRIALFVSALPPSYLQVFERLAACIEVQLFVLNPGRSGGMPVAAEADGDPPPGRLRPAAASLTTGNPLLASWGRRVGDFLAMLQDRVAEAQGLYAQPQPPTLLGALQADLLERRHRGPDALTRTCVAPDDRSLQIHICHGAMREVEVLHDQLLALFDADPDLSPCDVVVMAPDIEPYAPLVEAVFAAAATGQRIPFVLADRELLAQSPVVEAFFALLDIPGGRFTNTDVLKLLEVDALRRRCALAEADVAEVQGWIRQTGVRWGVDATTKAALGLPAVNEHTWRAGLDRLLLGYALPGDGEQFFCDILPCDAVEGSRAELFGRLQGFVENVFDLSEVLSAHRSLDAWADSLRALLERFFAPSPEESADIKALRGAIADLQRSAQCAEYAEPVSLQVVKSALRQHLRGLTRGGFFSGGAVTFCALAPISGIPFQVVCMIGVNDGSIPRPQPAGGINRMAQDVRRGDPSCREEDHNLFLQALLSARRCLYLSYAGQDIRDNSPLPPSVLVSELLDYLGQAFSSLAGEDIRSHVIRCHPLQPFDRRYFIGDNKLFSYNGSFCPERLALPNPFMTDGLPEPEAQWRTVEVAELVRFYTNPARYLLQKRLDLWLDTTRELMEPREPFELDPRQRARLLDYLLARLLERKSLPEVQALLRAQGALPHGAVGAAVFRSAVSEVEGFALRLREHLPAEPLQSLEVHLQVGGFRLIGCLNGVAAAGRFGFRLARLRPRDWLFHWICHLVLNEASPAGVRPVSCWIAQDQALGLQPVAAARIHLEALLTLYWRGLQRPLHFFPRAAFAYTKALGRSGNDPLAAALNAWIGSEFTEHGRGECEDPYYQLAFRSGEPLDEEFEALAGAVFQPIFAHRDDPAP